MLNTYFWCTSCLKINHEIVHTATLNPTATLTPTATLNPTATLTPMLYTNPYVIH